VHWKRVAVVIVLVLVAAMGGYQMKAHAQQEFPKPCRAIIPSEWGEFRGIYAGTGMIFEDKNGTLRVIYQLPCQIDGGAPGTPYVSAVLQRK
jgi:hypothetical protein